MGFFDVFFDEIRESVFNGRMSKAQVNGINLIIDCYFKNSFDAVDEVYLARLSYILASVHHETGARWQPVRETFAKTDKQAVMRLQTAYNRGKLRWVKNPYWNKDVNGKSWFGRGFIQITHKDNYIKMGTLLNVDLITNPSAALQQDISAKIAVRGMIEGSFTGKQIRDYINDEKIDFIGARRIVNGTDRATKIAGYAESFNDAFKLALGEYDRPNSVKNKVRSDGKPPLKSTTNFAAISGCIATVAGISDQGKEIVANVSEAFNIAPEYIFMGVAVGAAAYIIWERYLKYRDKGV